MKIEKSNIKIVPIEVTGGKKYLSCVQQTQYRLYTVGKF